MRDDTVLLQPAYILNHRPYRESSQLLDCLTPDFGVVTLVAPGTRRLKSFSSALMMPFKKLEISFQGRGELKTLISSELVGVIDLAGLSLYCGYYVNELLTYFIHKGESQPEIFHLYQHCLRGLSQGQEIERLLRQFELKLLDLIGYGLALETDAEDGSPIVDHVKYSYRAGLGVVRNERGYIYGSTLKAMQQKEALGAAASAEAKLLMRTVIDDHLQGKPLKSRIVLASVIKYL